MQWAALADDIYETDMPAAEEVPAARRALDRWLDAHGVIEGVRAAARLVASELVANAVQHARTGFRLSAEVLDGQAVRIEVHDDDTRLPAAGLADGEATGGRGLQLVAGLAADWGAGTDEGDGVAGKVVWAVIDAPMA